MRRLINYVRDVLIKDSIPVWMSLILMVAGAVATYWLAPVINAQFEVQAARREFLVKNLESFSGDTKSLIDIVNKALNKKNGSNYNDLITEANPAIAKLQFSATQLVYIVPDHSSEIVSFQKTLDQLQNDLLALQSGADATPILARSKTLLAQSLRIYEALLAKAGLGDKISRLPSSGP